MWPSPHGSASPRLRCARFSAGSGGSPPRVIMTGTFSRRRPRTQTCPLFRGGIADREGIGQCTRLRSLIRLWKPCQARTQTCPFFESGAAARLIRQRSRGPAHGPPLRLSRAARRCRAALSLGLWRASGGSPSRDPAARAQWRDRVRSRRVRRDRPAFYGCAPRSSRSCSCAPAHQAPRGAQEHSPDDLAGSLAWTARRR